LFDVSDTQRRRAIVIGSSFIDKVKNPFLILPTTTTTTTTSWATKEQGRVGGEHLGSEFKGRCSGSGGGGGGSSSSSTLLLMDEDCHLYSRSALFTNDKDWLSSPFLGLKYW